MSHNQCNNWVDCGDPKRHNLTMHQLWQLLIEADEDDCPALRVKANVNVTASVTTPLESSVTSDFIQSAEAPGSQTLAGLITAYGVWKAANPTRRVVREVAGTGGDGIPYIHVSHTA